MNRVREWMPGHNQREIMRNEMSTEERILEDMFLLNMRGGNKVVNGHHSPHSENHYPRRTVGHDHLPERSMVNGHAFYVRHCIYNFGTNNFTFDFALSEDNHDGFPSWDAVFQQECLTYVFIAMLRNHSWRTAKYKLSIRDQLKEINDKGVRVIFSGWSITEHPALIGQHRVHSRRRLYRANFSLAGLFEILKAQTQSFEL